MADGYLRESGLCRFHHHEPRVRRAVGPPRQPGGSVPSSGHDGARLRPDRRDHAIQLRLSGEQKVRPENGCDVPAVLGAALCPGGYFSILYTMSCLDGTENISRTTLIAAARWYVQ